MIGKIYSTPDITWTPKNSGDNSPNQIFHSITSSPVQWSDSGSPAPLAMPYRSRPLSRPLSPQTAPSTIGADGWIWPAPDSKSPSSLLRLNNDGTFYHATEIVLMRSVSGFTYARS